MNIQSKTVLVTGGGSGIGYAIAKLLSEKGNKVILSGRNAAKIEKAAKTLGLDYIVCDVTNAEAVNNLVTRLNTDYDGLSVLINNAGVANLYKLSEDARAYEKSKQEFETNYFAPVRLTEALLPLLKKQPEAAIINITSNVTFHPLLVLPTYSDSKAALHSHTVALRLSLSKDTNIKVFEVMPSLINTDATKDMGGEQNGLPPQVVAEDLYYGLEEDRYEIYVGETGKQRDAYFANPVAAVESFNQGLF
ncbi:SDR family oxidoreductase [Chitinophaga pinensis]|uniref:Short-chain dehydrogenase/reductase SDR n=1 Tax=Chitinophaga pinensis (strain ATCC 43595 / DSM 2588 / LMG 13176 / NBRC 15968 / NCIMB 11800 / UQM 2034) TaxID=485918 RepID=A0A979G2P5_CHIPD|nr:SDR family NAD(P)-dependent oxidoreductase [Chitinophaga pinensis]ACU59558.1 short-chain dehydrogenase/reductase SDR [Chitinophaga pinensis DSM 2588]